MNFPQLPFFGRMKLTDKDGNPIQGAEQLGARLKEFGSYLARALTNAEIQGGFNFTKPVQPPPNIQNLTVTGQNGHFQIAIQDQSSGLGRGVKYFVEHADNPSFTNAHVEDLGSSRNRNITLGNVTRYFRAYSAYQASGPSQHVYHGSAQAPVAVKGGGPMGGPAFLPSQGSGTSAPNQTGFGPGPVLVRSETGGFDWTLQQARGAQVGFNSQGTPASNGAIGGAGGGGGGTPVVQPALYDTYANWTLAKYPPSQYSLNTTFTITNWNFVTYIVRSVAGSNKWVYESGVYSITQSAIPANGFNGVALGTNDSGLKLNVTDYAHVLQWSGSAWTWGPGESGSGYFSDFAVAPTGNGWHACDGSSNVKYLKSDGTTGTVTLPNTAATSAYRESASAYSNTINAAQAPTVTPTGTVSATFSGDASGSTNVLNTGGSTAVVPAPYTPSGSISASFTGASDTTVLPGDPIPNYQAITYFRQ